MILRDGATALVVDGMESAASEIDEVRRQLRRYGVVPEFRRLKDIIDALPKQDTKTLSGGVRARVDGAHDFQLPGEKSSFFESGPFSFVYVACHYSRPHLICDKTKARLLLYDFTRFLSENNALTPGSTLFVAGCRSGGLNEAWAAFHGAEELEFWCGCEYVADTDVFDNAIHNFIYRTVRKRDPAPGAAKVASDASGMSFVCASRSKVENKIFSRAAEKVQKSMLLSSAYVQPAQRLLFNSVSVFLDRSTAS